MLTDFGKLTRGIFGLVTVLKVDSEEVDGGRCVRGRDGTLCFNAKDRGRACSVNIERIMNEENDWDHNVEEDTAQWPVDCVSRDKVVQVLNEMKMSRTFRCITGVDCCQWGSRNSSDG